MSRTTPVSISGWYRFAKLWLISAPFIAGLALDRAMAACPDNPDLNSMMSLYAAAREVTSIQFTKIDREEFEVNSWRFRVAKNLKSHGTPPTGIISFFVKPEEEPSFTPKFNDRFIAFNEMRGATKLGNSLKAWFLNPAGSNRGFCMYRSSIYLEDLIAKTSDQQPTRDRTCNIQLSTLENNLTIKEALGFRCANPELERKRLALLANSYASAKRYGNAVTALEMSNGNLNANTLSIVIGWADNWEETDDRAAKRFVERILNQHLRAHMEKTKQMPAIIDILNDKKRYKNLRGTDWFDNVVSRWIAMQPSPTPNPGPKPVKDKTAPKTTLPNQKK